MTYETFKYLNDLLDKQLELAHKDYLTALDFIPLETPKRGKKTAVEIAHEIFQGKRHKILLMQTQLKDAAAQQYVDHPDKAMREFWGIPT